MGCGGTVETARAGDRVDIPRTSGVRVKGVWATECMMPALFMRVLILSESGDDVVARILLGRVAMEVAEEMSHSRM
jgi:hypothetical protein